ncbi:hypothetical protein [Paenibacillus sp. 32O-W]|nr:hypothetical protein [Paenibacillus sp. 32O-W]
MRNGVDRHLVEDLAIDCIVFRFDRTAVQPIAPLDGTLPIRDAG